ncbi:TPA: flagellin, partial [Campylobacter jejuni]
LTSRDGRGIKVTGTDVNKIGLDNTENYGKLSLVKNDGRDISISGTGFGFGENDYVHEASVSLRESKGQIDSATAAAMGFDTDKMQYKTLVTGGVSDYMNAEGNGYSEGSDKSIGSGQGFSKLIAGKIADLSTTLGTGTVSNLMDNTFSDKATAADGYSTMAKVISTLKISTSGWGKALADSDVLKYMKASVVDMMKAAGG